MEKEIYGYQLSIESVRREMLEHRAYLETTRKEIAQATHTAEKMAIDTCTMRVRMKELELDEELVKKSENEAIMEKIIAQKRLVELGGYESAVRTLKKALQDAKRDLTNTQNEKANVINEERKLEQELHNLGQILQRCRLNCVKIQEEYSGVMKSKQEMDAKLKQLTSFLQPGGTPTSTITPSMDQHSTKHDARTASIGHSERQSSSTQLEDDDDSQQSPTNVATIAPIDHHSAAKVTL